MAMRGTCYKRWELLNCAFIASCYELVIFVISSGNVALIVTLLITALLIKTNAYDISLINCNLPISIRLYYYLLSDYDLFKEGGSIYCLLYFFYNRQVET